MPFDLQRFKLVFFRFWWFVPLFVSLALIAAYAWLQRQPNVYTSVATVEVAQSEKRAMKVDDVRQENPAGLDYISTVVEALLTNSVCLGAADQLGWKEKLTAQGQTEAGISGLVRSKVTTRWRKNTRLIDVVATDTDPVKARDLANAIVQTYLKQSRAIRTKESGSVNEFLVGEAERLRKKLLESEKKLADYKVTADAVSVDDKQNLVLDRLKQLSTESTEANSTLLRLEADLSQLKQIDAKNIDRLLQVSSVAELPQVVDIKGKLAAKEAEFSALKLRYLELHPKYQAAQNEIGELKLALNRTLSDSVNVLDAKIQSAKDRASKLNEAVKAQEKEVNQLEQVAIPYRLLTKEVEADRKLYDAVWTRVNETGIVGNADLDRAPVTLKDAPIVPDLPSSPNKKQTMTKSGMMGLIAALLLIFLIDRMDQSVRSVEQAETEFGQSVLAVVPDEKLEKEKLGHVPIIEAPSSFQAEAYRTLRTSLSLMGDESQRRVFLVTSAIPAEGKTRTSVNLALAFAQQGLQTLLIDADLRRPSIAKLIFASEEDKPKMRPVDQHIGLAELLSGLAQPEQVMRATPLESLKVITAGGRCPNPAELVAQPAFREFLALAATRFDRVIVDSSPVNSVSDALVIAPMVHGVVLVVRGASTPRAALKKALDAVKGVGGKLTGIVINRLPARLYGYYGHYRYDTDDPYVKQSGYAKSRKRTT